MTVIEAKEDKSIQIKITEQDDVAFTIRNGASILDKVIIPRQNIRELILALYYSYTPKMYYTGYPANVETR